MDIEQLKEYLLQMDMEIIDNQYEIVVTNEKFDVNNIYHIDNRCEETHEIREKVIK